MYQQAAWVISLLLCFFAIFVFMFVFSRAGKKVDYAEIQKKGYFIRNIWFILLFAALLTASYFSLKNLPYDRAEAKSTPIDVDVTAMQFGYQLSADTFKTGDYIAFHVTSKDVNHGFGLYDQNMEIVAQTQAMPEYFNTVYYQFTKPGKYTILCLEYCGVAHHVMKHEIVVKD